MKRKILFVLFIIALAAMVSAQDGSRRGRVPTERSTGRSQARATVTITGTMVVANGMPALKSGDDTYLIGGISSLIGFVDGLKEGAQVTVEGSVFAYSGRISFKYLQASKLTLGGKSYDLSPSFGGMRPNPNGPFMPPIFPRPPQLPQAPGGPIRNQGSRTPQRR